MRSRVPGRLSQRNLLTLLAAALLLVGFVVLPATSQQAYASPVRAERRRGRSPLSLLDLDTHVL